MNKDELGTPYHADEAMSYDVGINLSMLLHEVKAHKDSAETPALARHWAVLHTELEKALAYYRVFVENKTSIDS